MENQENFIESLYERSEAYGKTSLELVKLKSLELIAVVLTSMVSRISIIIMYVLFSLFLNVGISIWLGEYLGKTYYGFIIVSVFYLFGALIFQRYLHQWIKDPLGDLIVNQALQ